MTEPQDFFVDSWNIYHKLVARNYMFHREIYAAVEKLLRDSFSRPFSLLDLGCGDASFLAPILKSLDLDSYRGIDLADTALRLAAENLRGLSRPADLRQAEMLNWLETDYERYDMVFSSFALHHLPSELKLEFFRHSAERLVPGGLLLLIDVARDPGQDLPAYHDAYCGTMEREWTALLPQELEFAVTHVRNNDQPETLDDLLAMAERAGLADIRRLGQYTWHHALSFGKGNRVRAPLDPALGKARRPGGAGAGAG